MKNSRFAPAIASAFAALFLAAAAPARHLPGLPVVLQAQPHSPLDAAARKLMADDLAAARARGDRPLVLIGSADLGAGRPALFVQLQSPQQCGSGGCTTSVYEWEHGKWVEVLDSATGRLAISPRHSHGRPELLTDSDRFVWTGHAYRSTKPAPALDLRPHPTRRKH